MIDPTYLKLDEWTTIGGTAFKILSEESGDVTFQTSLILNNGQVPELDSAYPYPAYGFYFSATKSGFFIGICLGRYWYSNIPLNDPKSFLAEVKLKFPEYGQFLEKNHKNIFRSLIPT